MKYYIIAGEASGDLHGSNLVRELKQKDPSARFRGYGGDLMIREGVEVVKHISELDFMGFWEILVNLRTILGQLSHCRKDLAEWKPDAVILIDYPGFNLRIAETASRAGIRVFYYISPQLWAWKQGRILKIKKFVDKLFVILPFEKDFYARFNYQVDFVGHPLLDAVSALPPAIPKDFKTRNDLDSREIIALLPGSRKQEIKRILPVMLSVVPRFSEQYNIVIAATTAVSPQFYHQFTGQLPVTLVVDQTYDLMRVAAGALITSGTATLEAALLNLPQVVCYKANPLSFAIARRLVHLKYISLVNLILQKDAVKELIQKDMNEETLAMHLENILFSENSRQQIFADYVELQRKLGGKGASAVTAELITGYLKKP